MIYLPGSGHNHFATSSISWPLPGRLSNLFNRQSYAVDWGDERAVKMTGGIVAFTLTITRLEGKRKLSQNRSVADRQGVIAALSAGNGDEQRVAATMTADLSKLQEAD